MIEHLHVATSSPTAPIYHQSHRPSRDFFPLPKFSASLSPKTSLSPTPPEKKKPELDAERDKYKMSMMNFEETELRLGLPGGSATDHGELTLKGSAGKRGFSETASVDLKLNLSSNNDPASVVSPSSVPTEKTTTAAPPPRAHNPTKPPAKAQVVGWPPVRSFRKNIVNNVQRSIINNEGGGGGGGGAFVKVSMDGAPYLRKVDIKLYKSYQDLSDALAKMFSSFTIGKCGSQGMKDLMNETKLNGSDYVPTYQDKDGDWMLVGDVPWEMFVESCTRLRIMKGSEAIGLAPRAVEKCKNKNRS